MRADEQKVAGMISKERKNLWENRFTERKGNRTGIKRRIRTGIRRAAAGWILLFLLAFGEIESAAYGNDPAAAASLSLNARAAALIDADTGRVLYGKSENEPFPMASTTKIMTCILALENGNLDDLVTVSSYAASMPDVQLNIREGEKYRLEDLLYSLMLESHNDSAVAIAEHIAGSREAFAKMMNEKARVIGCEATCFITPNGLDAADEATGAVHSTTAAELALILRYCIHQSPEKEAFLTITRAPSHGFSDSAGKRSFSCINHNALLTMMEGAVSGKTGFTNDAGYCYVGEVKKDGRTFIAALLGSGWPPHKTYKWRDMDTLITHAEKAYDYYEILDPGLELPEIQVADGIKEETGLMVRYPDDPSLKVLMDPKEPVRIVKKIASFVSAPVLPGLTVGQVDYYVSDTLIASYPVQTTDFVGRWDLEFCSKTLLKKYLI